MEETTNALKQEMARWSQEVNDRHYFELKVNNFLKSENQRLENEVLRLRNENAELKLRIQNICNPEPPKERVNNQLEID